VAAAFLRAYDDGLVAIGPDGRLRFPRFRNACSDGWALFFKRRLALSWAESFTQLAFGAGLVLDRGWDPSRVQFEDHPFDVGGYRPGGLRPLVLAEAKRTVTGPGSASAVIAGVMACAGGPPARLSASDMTDALKKYHGLLDRRPEVFAVSGPGFVQVFRVRHRSGGVRLTPADNDVLAPA
jgi:hypothetical protein